MTPYYDQDGVTIYNGDCLHVLPALPNNSVDLILTDPPYFKVKGDAWDNQWSRHFKIDQRLQTGKPCAWITAN